MNFLVLAMALGGNSIAAAEPEVRRTLDAMGGAVFSADGRSSVSFGTRFEYDAGEPFAVDGFVEGAFGARPMATVGGSLIVRPWGPIQLVAGSGVQWAERTAAILLRPGIRYSFDSGGILVGPAAYAEITEHSFGVLLGVTAGRRF